MSSSKNEKVNENEVNLDEVYDKIGQFGIYQLSILILVSFTATITSSTAYSVVFFAAQPEFRCKLPNYENDTYQIQSEYHKHLIDIFIPKDSQTQRTCQLKVYNNLSIDLITNTTPFLTEECHDYVFSSEYYTNTVVTSWKLVCDREGIKSTFSSLYFFGYFAVVLVGLLGDAYGRKLISYIFIVLCALAAILTAVFTSISSIPVSVQIVLFAALRLILGIVSNVYIIGMVLVIELVGPKWRVTASNAFYYCYVLGEFITLAMGVAFKDYRAFNICLAVFLSLFVCYFWVVPESPRFLIIKSRRNEAYQVLRCIAKSNRKEFDESFLDSNLNEIVSNHSDSFNLTKIDSAFPLAKGNEKPREKSFARKLLIAFKSSTFRTRLIVTMINWFGNTFVYDGLSFNIGALGGNPYLNYVYGALVELAGISASHFALEKIGRKVPYTVCLLLAGLSLVSIAVIPHHLTIAITVMALLGKFFISFTFNAVYVVTAEAYPTEIRNTAVSFCSAQSRIGGVIAPYVQLLGSLYWFPLPYLIYGASALVASISYIIFMPETKGKKLLDKLEDMEG